MGIAARVVPIERFGADMDIFGSLLGGAASLIGGFMNTSAQEQINAQNIQQQNFMASGGNLPALVRNANAAGINPLAALGVSSPGFSGSVSPEPGGGLAAVGAQIMKSASEAQDKSDQLDNLKSELVKSQIAKTQADTNYVNQQAFSSRMDRAFGDPGRPHTPTGAADDPFPAVSYFRYPDGSVIGGRSQKKAESDFAGDPVAMAVNAGDALSRYFPLLNGLPYGWGLGSRAREFVIGSDRSGAGEYQPPQL